MEVSYIPEMLTGEKVELLDTTTRYILRTLDEAKLGIYNGWRCLSEQNGPCQIYVSKQWDILLAKPWNTLYTAQVAYDALAIVYTFKNSSWISVLRVTFVSKAFE